MPHSLPVERGLTAREIEVVRRRSATRARIARALVVFAVPAVLSTCRPEPTGGQVGTEPVPSQDARGGGEQAPASGMAWVIFDGDTVVAEVARTPEERSQGLMYRESLADGAGMLFVFSDAEVRSFWMKNTYIPLDLAYLDSEARIVNILQMEPESSSLRSSTGPAMFALEVPLGWFADHEIEAGAQAEIVFGR